MNNSLTQPFRHQIILPLALILIYALAYLMQSHLFINWDVDWLMHATRRLLAGGTYSEDFPENNPPMILYLYIPPVLLNKFFAVNLVTALRLYILTLSAISLYLCYQLICQLFTSANRWLSIIFITTLAAAFLILPIYEFGQRENILTILIMPYILTTAARLQKIKINPIKAVLIGFAAALGFALKPHFLLVFALIEVYHMIHKRNFFACLRPDSLLIILIIPLYLLSIFIFQPDYINNVVPLAMRNYFIIKDFSWLSLINTAVIFCIFTALFYFIQPTRHPFKHLCNILFLSMIGFLLIYFIQRTFWWYHLLPAFSIAVILFILKFSLMINHDLTDSKTKITISFLGLFISAIILNFLIQIYLENVTFNKNLKSLRNFLRAHAYHQTVYFLTTACFYEYGGTLEYAGYYPASRYPWYTFIRSFLKREQLANDPRLQQDKIYFLNNIASELNSVKPHFIFIDKQDDFYPTTESFNFLTYLKQNKNFQHAWNNYHYVTTIQDEFYKFDIYQRNKIELNTSTSLKML